VTAPGVQNLIWGKLLVNVAINALTAVLRVPNGDLLRISPAAEVMRAAVAEAEAVAKALGVALPYPDAWAQAARIARRTAANRSSMLQDIEHGRRTEVGQINGAVAEAGRALGIPTPVNDTLTRLVKCLEPAAPARC
jgi:2-dehydropantoate 2-reductase